MVFIALNGTVMAFLMSVVDSSLGEIIPHQKPCLIRLVAVEAYHTVTFCDYRV